MFKEQLSSLANLEITRHNLEHRPITYELNLKPGDALWWGKPAYLLQPYNKLAPKPHLRSAPLLEEAQKGLL